MAGLSVFTGTMFFLGSSFIADTVFSKPHLQFYFAIAAFFIIFQSLMNLNTQAVRGIRLIRMFAFMQILPSLSKLIILILITIFFPHPDNPVYAMLTSIAITALAGGWIMDRSIQAENITTGYPAPHIHEKYHEYFTAHAYDRQHVFYLKQIGVIMMGVYRPESEVGILFCCG